MGGRFYRKIIFLLLLIACGLGSMATAPVDKAEERDFGDRCFTGDLASEPTLVTLQSMVQENAIQGFRLESVQTTVNDNCIYHFVRREAVPTAELPARADQFAAALKVAKGLDAHYDVLNFWAYLCSPAMSREASEVVLTRIAAGYRYVSQVPVSTSGRCEMIFVLEPF